MRSILAPLLLLTCVGCSKAPPPPPGYQGVVEFDERIVAFEVSGRVVEVPANRGDHVKDGDTLARIDDASPRLMREARKREADAARDELALLTAGARSEDVENIRARINGVAASEVALARSAARTRKLFAAGAISSAEMDKANAELARASSERMALEQQLKGLRAGARSQEVDRLEARVAAADAAVALEDHRVSLHEPKAHVPEGSELEVLEVHVSPGELATVGAPVVTLGDVDHPYVDVFIAQQDIAGYAMGKPATVRTDATPQPLPAKVEFVSRQTEFTPRYIFSERERKNLVIRVRVRVDDKTHLLHSGVPAFVRFDP